MEDKLYTLIGKLFTEGHEMQAQLIQLQNAIKAKDEELGKVHAELHRVNLQIKALKNGQEQT